MTTQRASFADAQGDADAGAHRSAAIVREMTAVDLAPIGGSHARVSVRVPADYLALRRADPDAARAARESSSEAFGRLFGEGLLPSWTAEGYVFSGPPGPDVKGAGDG